MDTPAKVTCIVNKITVVIFFIHRVCFGKNPKDDCRKTEGVSLPRVVKQRNRTVQQQQQQLDRTDREGRKRGSEIYEINNTV